MSCGGRVRQSCGDGGGGGGVSGGGIVPSAPCGDDTWQFCRGHIVPESADTDPRHENKRSHAPDKGTLKETELSPSS